MATMIWACFLICTRIVCGDPSASNVELACVTGGSGYIAGHVCKLLREAGFHVRATVRSKSDEKTGFLEAIGVEVIEGPDLLVPGSFVQAFDGCHYVHHCASPTFFAAPDNNGLQGLVRPALEGTVNVLTAAKASGTVARVIMTSSCAAITWEDKASHPEGTGHVWTEDDWQEDNSLEKGPYRLSKRLAEHAAWDFLKENPGTFDLAVINPALVLGPVLNSRVESQSILLMKSFVDGSHKKVGSMAAGIVDVRDVAQAHVNAMKASLTIQSGAVNSRGEARFILSSENSYSMLEIVQLLKADPGISSDFPIPTQAIGPLPQNTTYSNRRAREVLNISFYDLKQTLSDGIASLVEHGVVSKRRHQEL